jgi:hypothetical protein
MTSDWRRVSQLFHEALARDVRDRAAFLDEACAGDGRLRQEAARFKLERSPSGQRRSIWLTPERPWSDA